MEELVWCLIEKDEHSNPTCCSVHTTLNAAVRALFRLPASHPMPPLETRKEAYVYTARHNETLQEALMYLNDGLVLHFSEPGTRHPSWSAHIQPCTVVRPVTSGPLWVTMKQSGRWVNVFDNLHDAVIHLASPRRIELSCRLRSIEDVWFDPGLLRPHRTCGRGSHPDADKGAVFQMGDEYDSGAGHLWRRTVQPDGPVLCDHVVEELARPGRLPVSDVPEVVASYL